MKKTRVILTAVICLLAVVMCLSACGKKNDLTAPENIRYDGTYITWNKVANAEYYMVQVGNAEAVRNNSTTFYYAGGETPFDVTVSAVCGDDSKSTTVNFKPLGRIENLTVANDGVVSWDTVAGATSYIVSINGAETSTTDTTMPIPVGSNRVKVKPAVTGDSSFWSRWSDEKNIYVHTAPSNIRYDGADLAWQGTAAAYEVNINGKIERVNGTQMAYASGNNDFSVSIKAVGDYVSTFDSAATTDEFHYLDTVRDMTVSDGIVSWSAVENAEGYMIKINGVALRNPLTENCYRDLVAGSSQDVQVMPYNNSGNYFSSWSAEKTIYLLEAPVVSWNHDLELDGDANNNLTWNTVNGAAGYKVRLTYNDNAEVFSYSEAQRAFAYAYTDVGVYTVEVMATAPIGSGDYYDSKYCAAYTIERLPAPTKPGNNFIISDKTNLAAGFTVNYIPVNGASGYQLYKDGVLVTGKQTTGSAISVNDIVDGAVIGEQHITYMVRAMGSHNVAGRSVKLPCLTANALSFDITVQATPQNPTMSGFVFSWDAVASNNGFSVMYSGSSYTAQINSYDLSTLQAGTYSISVCTRGNGAEILASNASAPVTVERLQAPTEIKITSDGNGTLEWRDVANAKSYQAYLDLSEQALDATAYGNMYQFIETDGTTLHMIAVANYYNTEKTVYYMTSQASPTQQFIRLSAPVFPEGAVANSIELLWNAPANINTAEYTPTYQVFSQIGEQIGGGDVNGLKFNIEYLAGGASYTFYVKAIGNDTKYLDSDYSVAITVYKLATPVFSLQDGKYVWSGVTNASSYYMEIDGVKVTDDIHVSGGTYSYTPRYTTATKHTVSLKAVGDGRNNLDSTPYNYEQKAVLLQAPVIEYGYSADAFTTGGSIVVTITTPSANASGYQYEIAGESITSTALTYSKVIQSPGSYMVRVKALGGAFDADETYYVDSQYAGGNTPVVLLASPAGFKINSDGVITWSDVQGRVAYKYQLSFNGGAYDEAVRTAYSATDVIDDYKQYRTITIKIWAVGNDGNIVDSAPIEWTWTNSSYVG